MEWLTFEHFMAITVGIPIGLVIINVILITKLRNEFYDEQLERLKSKHDLLRLMRQRHDINVIQGQRIDHAMEQLKDLKQHQIKLFVMNDICPECGDMLIRTEIGASCDCCNWNENAPDEP